MKRKMKQTYLKHSFEIPKQRASVVGGKFANKVGVGVIEACLILFLLPISLTVNTPHAILNLILFLIDISFAYHRS